MNQNKTYVFHTDPGHGWLAVRKSEVRELGIADRITPFSYVRGDTVYLEEDCDASTFFQAYEARFGKKPSYRSSYREHTPIRNYQSYHLGAL